MLKYECTHGHLSRIKKKLWMVNGDMKRQSKEGNWRNIELCGRHTKKRNGMKTLMKVWKRVRKVKCYSFIIQRYGEKPIKKF